MCRFCEESGEPAPRQGLVAAFEADFESKIAAVEVVVQSSAASDRKSISLVSAELSME